MRSGYYYCGGEATPVVQIHVAERICAPLLHVAVALQMSAALHGSATLLQRP
jgi:hypothetical protein